MDTNLKDVFGEQGPLVKLRKVMTEVGEQLTRQASAPRPDFRRNDLLDAAMKTPVAPAQAPPVEVRRNDLLDEAMGFAEHGKSFGAAAAGALQDALTSSKADTGIPTVTRMDYTPKSTLPEALPVGGGLTPGGGDAAAGVDCCKQQLTILAQIREVVTNILAEIKNGLGFGTPQAPPEPADKPKPPLGLWERFKGSMKDNLGLGGAVRSWDDPQGLYNSGTKDRKDAAAMKKAGLPGATGIDLLGRGKEAGGKVIASARDTSDLGGMGKMLSGLGSLAGAVPYVGKPIEALTKFGEVAFKAVDRLQTWSNQLHQANMQFTEFSGAMAGVQARQEVRDMMLSKERGDRRAGVAENVAQSKSGLAAETAKVGDFMSNVWGSVNSFFSQMATKVIKPFANAVDKLNEKVFGGGKKTKNPGLGDELPGWMDRATDEYYGQFGRPPRFGRGP